jgi:hypothetical protein
MISTTDAITRSDLQQVRTPTGTRTWRPISHSVLLDQVCRWLDRCGYEVVSECHTLTGGGQRYFGVLDVTTDRDHSDYRGSVGIRNSGDKQFAAGVVLGNRVLVCSNLMFEGEISLSRKHTRFIRRDLSRLVRDAVRGLAELRARQDERIERYRATRLSNQRAHDLLVRSLDHKVIPGSWIPHVLDEWRHPSHEEFAADGRTLWRLVNSFSEVWKRSSPDRIADRSRRLHQLLDAAYPNSIAA